MAEERTVLRKTRVGTVVSDKNDKTIVVSVERAARHRIYHKVMDRVLNLTYDLVNRLSRDTETDELGLRRLKKRKLRLKDMIAYIENKLIPDLDA